MFVLPNLTPAKLNSANSRSEKHGSDLVPAVDMSFTIDAGNTMLTAFDVDLLQALYYKDESAGGEQETLDGMEITHLPNMRFPHMGLPIKWDSELSGYTLTIDYGLGDGSALVFADCNVNNFCLTPKEGGTVEIKFRVQCASGLTEKHMGKVSLLIQHEVDIKLVAPEVAQELPVENPFPVQEQDKPLTASDVFIASAQGAA